MILELLTENNVVTFLVKNVKLSVLNAMRRIMLNNIESCVLDEIKIIRNTTIICDEVIKQRLQMIPILEGTDGCSVTINALNMDNDSEKAVTSDEIKVNQNNQSFCVCYPGIVICELKQGEELSLTAKIRSGTCFNNGCAHRPIQTAFFRKTKYIYATQSVIKSLDTYCKQNKINIISVAHKPHTNECMHFVGFSTNFPSLPENELLQHLQLPRNRDNKFLIVEDDALEYAFVVKFWTVPKKPLWIWAQAQKIFNTQMSNLSKHKYEIKSQEDNTIIITYFEGVTETILNPVCTHIETENPDWVTLCNYNRKHMYDAAIYVVIVFKEVRFGGNLELEWNRLLSKTVRELHIDCQKQLAFTS